MVSIEDEISGLTIADLSVGHLAIIREIVISNYSTRMISMGLLPGKLIKVLRKQPWKGSIYIELSNHFLGLRHEEAKLIKIDLQS